MTAEQQTTPAADVNAAPAKANTAVTPEVALRTRLQSLQDQIAKLQAQEAELIGRLETLSKLSAVDVGWKVQARVGRGKAATVVAGIVTGRSQDGDKLLYKVYHGQGFDAQLDIVDSSNIIDATEPTLAGVGQEA